LVVNTTFVGTAVLRCDLTGFGLIAELQPRAHDFGIVDAFQSSVKDFTLVNNTHRDITVSSIDTMGANANYFTVTSGSPGMLPANGGEKQITVEFAPLSHGLKLAELTVSTADSVFSSIKAELTGTGNVLLVETFDTTTMSDTAATTAEWGTTTPGVLTPTGLNSFGTGADGAYNPTSNANLDANNSPFNYTSINIPQGVKITVTGTDKLEIFCLGEVIINGELNLDGKDGANAPNGIGGSGGAGGGKGGDHSQPGQGTGGGRVGGAGGGGGFAVTGQISTNGGQGGVAYGNPELNSLVGGSGGGGGSTGGAGGGGSGGAVSIIAGGNIEIAGLITAIGGEGGGHARPQGPSVNGAGGGSGGAVKLISAADITFSGGSISVQGGMGDDGRNNATRSRQRGGYGSPGRIRLEDSDGQIDGIGGSIYPIPSAAIVPSPFTGGTGVDGAFNPTGNITLDTANSPFNYTSVNIPLGVTVTATGTNPLEIYSTGSITIAGTIDISGGNGANGNFPGSAVAGGGAGGRGGDSNQNGTAGLGQGGGHEGITSGWSGSSGGGFGIKGQDGCRSNKFPGGISYGNKELNPLLGGSGGGGGAGCFASSAKGGGGGGGGCAIRLQAAGSLQITGSIHSNGGEGGRYGGTFSLPGSGGSGGGILIQGNTVLISGSVSARGNRGNDTGCGGGYSRDYDEAFNWQAAWGGDGRIRIEAITGNVGGVVYSTKGKFACPDSPATNPLLTGTFSQGNLSINAGLVGQSKFFDSTKVTPAWQSAVVTGTDLNQVRVLFQGADDNGAGSPDPLTYTRWFDDLSSLPQSQYVRFKVLFRPGAAVPSVDQIELLFN